MKEKHLASFLAAVDKIVSGERLRPSEYKAWDEEAKELLFLAQALAESPPNIDNELADDDLDRVAGGVNPNGICEKKDKKP